MFIGLDGRQIPPDPRLGFRFEMAMLYAFRLHAAQTRKGTGTPYFGHLLGVASTVIEMGGNEDQAIAALLHDAAEDQGGDQTLQVIKSMFGKRVAKIAQSCSDDVEGLPRDAESWKPRKCAYLAHLRTATLDTLLVSLADKLYNARAIVHDVRHSGDTVFDRFNAGKDCTLWYYDGLVSAFDEADHKSRDLQPWIDDLDRVVKEMHEVAEANLAGSKAACPDETPVQVPETEPA